MPNRPNFPIPENIHPPMQCIQLCIPNEPTYKSVFAGLIYELTYWYNWQRTDGNEGAQCANVWKEIYNSIDWSVMSCCPEQDPFVIRIEPDGTYQRSTDGGATWTDSPQDDPRNGQPIFPPFVPSDVTDAKCTYADSVTKVIKNGIVNTLEDGMSVSEIFGVIVAVLGGIMAALATTVILAIVAAIVGGVAAYIVAQTIPALKAALTDDVWARLRCNFIDHMSADGGFDQTAVDGVYSQLATDESGIALYFLQSIIAAFGAVGLTNAARSGAGATDADCTDCFGCNATWIIGNVDGNLAMGTIVSHVGDTYVFASHLHTDGAHYLTAMTTDETKCCSILSITATSGHSMPSTGTSGARIICPNTQHVGNISGGDLLYTVGSLNYFAFNSSNAFEIEVVFG